MKRWRERWPEAHARWHAAHKRWRHSLRWRLVTLFVVLALATAAVFLVGTQRLVRGGWQGWAKPNDEPWFHFAIHQMQADDAVRPWDTLCWLNDLVLTATLVDDDRIDPDSLLLSFNGGAALPVMRIRRERFPPLSLSPGATCAG